MKKLTLFLCILFIYNMSDAAILDSIQTKITVIDTSSTFKQMYADFNSALNTLGNGLKVGSEKVYNVLVKQQLVYSIVGTIALLCSLISLFFWLTKAKSGEVWAQGSDMTSVGIFRGMQFVFSVFTLGASIFNIIPIITGYINPDFGAMTDIIEMACYE